MNLGVIQARSSSSRLPGKVTRKILGRPMLALQIERVRRSRQLDAVLVATSSELEDDAVAAVAADSGADCYRGSLDDVLDRFYRAAQGRAPSHVVRLTGDCPLADWRVIDRVIDFARQGEYDYASNTIEPTWPDGLDVEVMTFSALEAAWREAVTPVDREHVTPFLYRHPQRFRVGSLVAPRDLSGLRWTVDQIEDFRFATAVFEALYPDDPDFSTDDILAYLADHPDIVALNAAIERNEGYRLSIEKLQEAQKQ